MRQCRSTAFQKKPFATRYSPFAAVSAQQEPRPPTISPTKVGAQLLRHQLRAEARSMKLHVLRLQLQVETCRESSPPVLFRHEKFYAAVQEQCPPEELFANRYSPFAAFLARQNLAIPKIRFETVLLFG